MWNVDSGKWSHKIDFSAHGFRQCEHMLCVSHVYRVALFRGRMHMIQDKLMICSVTAASRFVCVCIYIYMLYICIYITYIWEVLNNAYTFYLCWERVWEVLKQCLHFLLALGTCVCVSFMIVSWFVWLQKIIAFVFQGEPTKNHAPNLHAGKCSGSGFGKPPKKPRTFSSMANEFRCPSLVHLRACPGIVLIQEAKLP